MLRSEVASASEWMRACSSAFVPLRVQSTDAHFAAQLRQERLSELVTLTSVTSRASEVIRDRPVISESPREDILLSVHRNGVGTVSQHNRVARLKPGAAVLYDASAPYTLSFPAAMSETVLQFPRSALSRSGYTFEELTARVLQPSGSLRALIALASGIGFGDQNRGDIEAAAIADSLAVLLVAALTAERHREPIADAELLTMALRMHVDEYASDPALTPESLARTFHLSLRSVQKLFEHDGDAPAQYIRRRRVAIAHDHLRSGCTVAEAAFRSGFVNTDTFSRAFKREIGSPPSSVTRVQLLP